MSYGSPAAAAEGELREKGSRFLARLEGVVDEAGARAVLAQIERRDHSATHHCWAWRLGWPAGERSSDDGEPTGTAGVPILQVLRGNDVSDAILVVSRWFGGRKLGKGGLARAYAGAAHQAVAGARFVERLPVVSFRISARYDWAGPVERLLAIPGVRLAEQRFGEGIEMVVEVDVPTVEVFEAAIADLSAVVSIERIDDSGTTW